MIHTWEDIDELRDQIEGRNFYTGFVISVPRWACRPAGARLPRRRFDFPAGYVSRFSKNYVPTAKRGRKNTLDT